ncbi:zinc finger protein CG2199 [Zeugodacus cucurbitae]|uniref:zinc finger protein CG2199 n=1 Tax=Zeugodacus cucurbitae TaxID=28588 RepID=UPI0023D8F250|nr:zinc finger protein CG2199 [Zeugodacus cucurbitae]
MNFLKRIAAKMKTCSLCKNKYDSLFTPNEQLLGTRISDVIQFIFSDNPLDFPPKFLICAACAASLVQTDIVLKRLSNALPQSRSSGKVNTSQQNGNDSADETHNTTQNESSSKAAENNMEWIFRCTHCEYTTRKAKMYKTHLTTKHELSNPRIYQCMYCTESYQRINGIQNHIATAHENKPRQKRQRRKTIAFDSPNVLSSTTIDKELDINALVVNINNANDTNPINESSQLGGSNTYEFSCGHCEYKTTHPKFFKRHLSIKHNDEDSRIYKCKKCRSTYVRQFALQNHIAYEHENKPKPQRRKSIALEQSTITEAELLIPKEEVVNDEEDDELRCELCLYQAQDAKQLRNHMVILHQNDSINQNEYNTETIPDSQPKEQVDHVFQSPFKKPRNQLSASEISSSDWVFQCSHCDFECSKKKKFRSHLNNEHNVYDNDIYKCLYCASTYERYSVLQHHVSNVHSIDLTGIESDSSQDHVAKKQKLNGTANGAEKHALDEDSSKEQTPTKKRKIEREKSKESCVVCGKLFATVDKLRAHMDKNHGGDEIKKCPNCDAQFRSLEKYEAHLFSEKCLNTKLACQYPGCPKRFNRPSKLQQHMREKHPDLID